MFQIYGFIIGEIPHNRNTRACQAQRFISMANPTEDVLIFDNCSNPTPERSRTLINPPSKMHFPDNERTATSPLDQRESTKNGKQPGVCTARMALLESWARVLDTTWTGNLSAQPWYCIYSYWYTFITYTIYDHLFVVCFWASYTFRQSFELRSGGA